MKLYEYLAKEVLGKAGVPIPPGRVVDTPAEAKEAVAAIGPAALKAQVLVGGRGKAGGIKFAATPEEAPAVASQILGMDLKGYTVERLYAEAKLDIERELYVSVTTDRGAKRPFVMASSEGGVEIEDVDDAAIVRRHVDPRVGVLPYFGKEMAYDLGLDGTLAREFGALVEKLYGVYQEYDAELVEMR